MGLFDKKQPGQRARPSAQDWNDILDGTLRARRGDRPHPEQDESGHEATMIQVRNDTGQNLTQFSAVGLGDPVITPTQNLSEFKRAICLKAVVPVAGTHENKWGICLESIAKDAIGTALVSGVVLAKVAFATAETAISGFAEIQSGKTSLQNSASGSAKVLYAEPSGTERWAIVRVGGAGGGGGTGSGGITVVELYSIECEFGALKIMVRNATIAADGTKTYGQPYELNNP